MEEKKSNITIFFVRKQNIGTRWEWKCAEEFTGGKILRIVFPKNGKKGKIAKIWFTLTITAWNRMGCKTFPRYFFSHSFLKKFFYFLYDAIIFSIFSTYSEKPVYRRSVYQYFYIHTRNERNIEFTGEEKNIRVCV